MSKPTLSVVIPTYLRDGMLKECLDSLATQTLPLHEVIVVDDGGSGSAREVVAQFGPRFRYLWQPNGGNQRARNFGARAATGEWIGFLDDDDLWLPPRHTRVAELMACGKVDLVWGDFTKFGDGWVAPAGVFDEIARQSPGFWDGVPREPGATYSVVGSFPTTRLLPVHPFWPSLLVIRRDLFERLKGWNEELRGVKSEDNEFSFRAIKEGQLGIIWTSTVHYRCHAGNDSNANLAVAWGRTEVWENILRKQKLTDNERDGLNMAISSALHEIVHSAFSQREYGLVLLASDKIDKRDLSVAEKVKVTLSRAIYTKIKKKKSNGTENLK